MALADFLKLVDDKLHEVFAHTPPDPVKARKPFIRKLDQAAKQFEDGKQPRGDSKWWAANNGAVIFTPNIDGRAILIGGKEKHGIKAGDFLDSLTKLRAGVEAGELDDQLISGETAAPAVEKKPRKGWSQERKDREAAKKAERLKAK